jgi:hypothetical protein
MKGATVEPATIRKVDTNRMITIPSWFAVEGIVPVA